MEIRKLIDLLRATIDPSQRQQAEEQLDQASKTCAYSTMPTMSSNVQETQSHFVFLLISLHFRYERNMNLEDCKCLIALNWFGTDALSLKLTIDL